MGMGFIGEIRLFACSYVPDGWLPCEGQQLPIYAYQVLYAIIGPRYGGDQRSYFNLPDLRGRVAMGAGQGPNLTPRPLGTNGGSPTATIAGTPSHDHALQATAANGDKDTPANTVAISQTPSGAKGKPGISIYNTDTASTVALDLNALTPYTGGGSSQQTHENRQPYLPIWYGICSTDGEWPPQPD